MHASAWYVCKISCACALLCVCCSYVIVHAIVICVCGAFYSWCIEMVCAAKWMCVGWVCLGVCMCVSVCKGVCGWKHESRESDLGAQSSSYQKVQPLR